MMMMMMSRVSRGSLYGDRLGEIPRLVYIATAADSDVIGEQLQWDDRKNG
jgi:hypothetical protein